MALYGICRTANTNQDGLDMQSIHDSCLIYANQTLDKYSYTCSALKGVACIQTDDSVNIGNKPFLELEVQERHTLNSKPASTLRNRQKALFNGATVKPVFSTVYTHWLNWNKVDIWILWT